jgi:hypothetical protein
LVNGCTGTLKKVHYWTDSEGLRHATSCEINVPSMTAPDLPNLPHHHIIALQDTINMHFVHPYSHKSCTIRRTQVPITPAFAMMAHRAQGQTMDQAVVDLQSCQCIELAYVMLSRVCSLQGLAILRAFDKRKIQNRLCEDTGREMK